MGEQRWVRSSLRHLSAHLAEAGHPVSPPTVGRLLRDMDYSLRVNVKQKEGAPHPDRDEQVEAFQSAGQPIISVDTKKKELIGDFKNPGQAWCQVAERVTERARLLE